MKTTEEIMRIIAGYFTGKPVLRAYLFGSHARGEADAESDVDVLVDLDYTAEGSLWVAYVAMQEGLAEKLGVKVDLVSSEGLSKYIAPFIHKDKVLVYER